MLRRTRIFTLLVASLALLLLAFLLSNGLSAWSLKKGSQSLEEVNAAMRSTLGVTDTTNWVRAARTTLLGGVPAVRAGDEAALDELLEQARFYVDGAEGFMSDFLEGSKMPGEEALADELQRRFRDYVGQGVEPQFTALRNGDIEAFLRVAGTITPALDEAYRVPLDQILEIRFDRVESLTQTAQGDTRQAYWTLGVAVALFILICAGLAIMFQRVLVRPLKRAAQLTVRIGDGHLDNTVVHDRRDEIGDLYEALAAMQTRLIRIVQNVRSGTGEVLLAAREIATANRELSDRTQSQAASLEQTSASMEQMTATIGHTAGNTRDASELVSATRHKAEEGSDRAGRAASAMKEIREASGRIVDIIAVIDNIAFQTNLLALNASVEAARAGEQGRGFAVVATEVRTLAQRSADSARDIRTLITDTEEKVHAGVALVEETATGLDAMVDQIRQVASLVEGIAGASQEQSGGIGQVNTAISQMDEMTQQNAAMVEEATAAAGTLQTQAEYLSAQVASFRLRESDKAGDQPTGVSQQGAAALEAPSAETRTASAARYRAPTGTQSQAGTQSQSPARSQPRGESEAWESF